MARGIYVEPGKRIASIDANPTVAAVRVGGSVFVKTGRVYAPPVGFGADGGSGGRSYDVTVNGAEPEEPLGSLLRITDGPDQ